MTAWYKRVLRGVSRWCEHLILLILNFVKKCFSLSVAKTNGENLGSRATHDLTSKMDVNPERATPLKKRKVDMNEFDQGNDANHQGTTAGNQLNITIENVGVVAGQNLPSVYEYFANGTVISGLVAKDRTFTLNGKEIRIVSGAIHYFRVHPDLWRDRLRKLRALGANAVETYVAWNLHEPRKGQFDFGEGSNDFTQFLDLPKFLRIAQEEDLLVLLRPGPYICTEWDFGGLPSWLQRDPDMKVRENNKPYLDRVKIYLDNLLPRIRDLQFTRGGPIIAIQIENEYGSFSPRHKEYLQFVADSYNENGFNESLHYTSDNGFGGSGIEGSLPGVLQTANFQSNPDNLFQRLREVQPDMPTMAMEFWSGWFNHWNDTHQAGSSPQDFGVTLDRILGYWNGSVNFYMFHGGTNFAFMAGGNTRSDPPYIDADVTSYDYDAPLSEAGDYTEKYDIAERLIEQYAVPKLRRPSRPPQSQKAAYPTLQFEEYLTYADIISQIPSTSKFRMDKPVSMENLPMNGDSGQSYGYIIYRKNMFISPSDNTVLKGSWPRDVAFLLVDGQLVQQSTSEFWINSIREFPVNVLQAGNHTVDLLVEPLTRVNFGSAQDFIQQKGIAPIHQSKLEINGQEVQDIEIIAAEFSNAWVKSLTNFTKLENSNASLTAPVLLQTTFNITGEPADTFLDMSKWTKGIVFVNGFNIGRYWRVGPQQNLYVPAPLLRTGINTITVFEQVQPHTELVFSDRPNLGPRQA